MSWAPSDRLRLEASALGFEVHEDDTANVSNMRPCYVVCRDGSPVWGSSMPSDVESFVKGLLHGAASVHRAPAPVVEA